MNFYVRNRSWSDRFLPEIKRIVGPRIIQTAPDMLDWHEATDLLTLDGKDLRIAARVRRHGYSNRFPHDFTIRTETASGVPTELSKIVNGKGDWLFYGHADSASGNLESWYLIDLKAFRAALIRRGAQGLTWGNKHNSDGTCFTWFDVRSFPADPPLVVASGSIPQV